MMVSSFISVLYQLAVVCHCLAALWHRSAGRSPLALIFEHGEVGLVIAINRIGFSCYKCHLNQAGLVVTLGLRTAFCHCGESGQEEAQ